MTIYFSHNVSENCKMTIYFSNIVLESTMKYHVCSTIVFKKSSFFSYLLLLKFLLYSVLEGCQTPSPRISRSSDVQPSVHSFYIEILYCLNQALRKSIVMTIYLRMSKYFLKFFLLDNYLNF